MKSLACLFFWWPAPGFDSQIQDTTKEYELCQQSCGLPPTALWHSRRLLPSSPWSQIHLDYATPITGQMFLDLIDAHTKWLEVFHVTAATSSGT